MIDSFKNFERLRYRLANDMRKLANDKKENSDSLRGEISNTIFATIFSAFITEIAFMNDGKGYNSYKVVKLISLFIVIYVISYILYNFLYSRVIRILEPREINSIDSGMDKMVQIQKDFDNIACDSILIAKEYKKNFKLLTNNRENCNLKIFYYYEIMHYLDVTCDKTEYLVNYKEDCIRTMDEATGVDIFRVINIKNMIQELDDFLDSEFENICGQLQQKEAIEYQHEQLKRKIQIINNKLQVYEY